MKIKSVSIAILFTLFLLSCGNSSESTDNSIKSEKAEVSDSELKEANDCDEFINQYEKWMDKYLVFLEKYIKNPTDAELASDYMKLAQEGSQWMSQWATKFYLCASNEDFEKRFDDISAKADKKMKELGLE